MAKDARAQRAMPLRGLPEEIVVWEILVRLDPKSLFRCRAVCRAWRSFTSARQFLLVHHSHQPSLPIFSRVEYASRFHHQEIVAFDHQVAEELHTIAKLRQRFRLQASCDGLVILSECGITGTCFYVSNLATRQCEYLGKSHSEDVNILGMYPHRPTGEYRLLLHRSSHERHMQVDLLPEGQIGCYVFTLGSDEPPKYIGWLETSSKRLKAPALVHDNLHWYQVHRRSQYNTMHNQIKSKYIIVFDTVAESFRQMRAPIVPSNSHAFEKDDSVPSNAHVFEMDGMLGIYARNKSTEIVDIWVLKNYKSEVWDLKYRIKLPVAEIKGQFEGRDDHWYAHVVSVDCDILLLVSFDRWVLHVNSDGKLVSSFNLDGGGFYNFKLSLKQTLVPHTFFPALKSCARSAWPFFCVSVPSKPLGGEGRNVAMAADSTTPTDTDDKWTNQGEGRVIAKPTRIKYPNRRFVGPEWVNST